MQEFGPAMEMLNLLTKSINWEKVNYKKKNKTERHK